MLRAKGLRCGSVKFVTPEVSNMTGAELDTFLRQQKWTDARALASTLMGGYVTGSSFPNSDGQEEFFSNFKEFVRLHLGDPRLWLLDKALQRCWWPGSASQYQALVDLFAGHRRLFCTDRRWVGLGPACMQKGDRLAVLTGGPMPVILRPVTRGQYYFIGECYVYDIATGQAYDILSSERVEERMFELI